ncbi:hypothetical protein PoB_000835200 [Plakobranchus ocellatus]|uniref:Uncharacterized protein n=1 Tax=Plakobranchus ocellatus TaxID=259542 RepID=A0AAV3YI17_9GAST|nr:hypothetical protein PoB_000835200 [Plakobranchus ocellatus]
MGHSEAINKNVYRCPLAVNEITRVGHFLLNIVDAQTYVPEPSYESNNKSQDKNDVSVDTEACGREETFDTPDQTVRKRPQMESLKKKKTLLNKEQ